VSEDVSDVNEFRHPVVREVLKRHYIGNSGLHIATQAEVPAQTGLGSSSAFTVGLLHAIHRLNGEDINRESLAKEAVEIERYVLSESGGWQDQFHAALGGFALYKFSPQGVQKSPNIMPRFLNDSLMLVPVGSPRDSSSFASKVVNNLVTQSGHNLAVEMSNLARETFHRISQVDSDRQKREVLSEGVRSAWLLKNAISGYTLDRRIQQLINIAEQNGALASKLCGAGGSGFVLLIFHPDDSDHLRNALGNYAVRLVRPYENGTESGPSAWESNFVKN
jgi:D-glycero-alpha-D-manno-heptose-7-phosphate kinase